jgi:hypothetical protein
MNQQELSASLLSIEDDLKSIDPSGTRVNEELGAVIAKINQMRKHYNVTLADPATTEYLDESGNVHTNLNLKLSPLAIPEYDNDPAQLDALEEFMLDPQYSGKAL